MFVGNKNKMKQQINFFIQAKQSTKSLQKVVKNALKIKSANECETMPKHSKKPELSDKRAVKTLIFRQFGLLNSNNKRKTTNAE